MNYKSILSFIAGCIVSLALSTFSAYAKEVPAANDRWSVLFNTERIANALNLTSEQTVKLDQILSTIKIRIENARGEHRRSGGNLSAMRLWDQGPQNENTPPLARRGRGNGPRSERFLMGQGPDRPPFAHESHSTVDRPGRRGPRDETPCMDRPGERREAVRGGREREGRGGYALGRRGSDDMPMGPGFHERFGRGDGPGPRGPFFGMDRPSDSREAMRGDRNREERRELALNRGRFDESRGERGSRRGQIESHEGSGRREPFGWAENSGLRGPFPGMNLTDNQRERIRDILMENPQEPREEAAGEKTESRQEILERMRARAERGGREFAPRGRRGFDGPPAELGERGRIRGMRGFSPDGERERGPRSSRETESPEPDER